MAIPSEVADAIERLSTGAPTGYNNDPFNASTNPYGFDDGGYINNFFAALNDLTTVTTWLSDEVAPLLGITTELEALGAIVAELQALAGIAPDLQALAALDTEISALAAIASNITTVATNASAVVAVSNDIAKVAAVNAALADIEAVAGALGNISTIIGMSANIATVAARASDIGTLADIEDGTTATGAIQAVAAIASAVSNVSSNSADVVAVAGALSDVNTVAGISADVSALGPIATDVATVAAISDSVEQAADNIDAIIAAPAAATAARKSVRHILVDLTSTADSHPGAGHIRFSIDINAATPGATGTLFHDIADADGGDITGWVESWDDVINATGRGIVSLVNETDPSISLALRITGSVSSATGYRKAPFTLLQKSGTIVDEAEFTESFAASGNDGTAIGGGATIIGAVSAGELLQAIDGSSMEGAGKTADNLFDVTANDLDDIPDGSTYVKYAATEKSKLAGIEAAADVTDAANVGAAINGSTAKTTPVNADRFAFWDAASSLLKYVTWQNLLATAKTYLDTLYSAIGHSHAWSAITGKPTTVAGAGLTDAVTLTGSETLTNKTLTTPILTLEQGPSVAPTAEGRIAWDTDDDKLKVGTGSGTKTFSPDSPLLMALAAGDIWVTKAVGEIVYLRDDLTGCDTPDASSTLYTFIKLTAGLTGSGGFNNGKLTSESTSGSAPLVSSTAIISHAGSPMDGQTVRLLNTEGRVLRPSTSAGTLQNDQMQGHYHYFSDWNGDDVTGKNVRSSAANGNARLVAGSSSADNLGNFSISGPLTDGTNGTPRTGNETRSKNVGVTAYMRIK